MLEPFGSEIMRILNVLTPSEIERYTDTAYHQKLRGSVSVGEEEKSFDAKEKNAAISLQANSQNNDEESDSEATEHEAKIIPLHEKFDDFSKEENEACKPLHSPQLQMKATSQVKPQSDLESIGVLSGQTLKKLEEEKNLEVKKKRDSSSVFILKNKKKLEQAQHRLIGQTALKSYRELQSVELIEVEYDEETQEQTTGKAKGVLVNKDQY
jgi:hypothetical protein